MRSTGNHWCLVGIPDHEAVMNVGGRVGAAGGPKALERLFARLKGRDGVHESLAFTLAVSPLGHDVEANHRQAADIVRDSHLKTGTSVVVGGGHDHGYSHLLGICEALSGRDARLGCINLDAHLDVRKPDPKITSGSPFYLALASGLLMPENFIEFGIQRHCNAPELWDYVESQGVEVIPFEKLRHGLAADAFRKAVKRLAAHCDAVVISLDLDCAAQAFAPGVSAPVAEGFTPSDILDMMAIAGEERKCVSLGIFELNPEHDIDDRTARLGATAAYHYVAQRLKTKPIS